MKLISKETIENHTQTSGVRNEIDKILSPVLLAHRIYGNQLLDPKWSWRSNVLKLTCVLTLVIYVIVGTVEFMQRNTDIMIFCEAFFTIIITLQFAANMLIFIQYRSAFRDVYVMAKMTLLDIAKEIVPEKSVYLIMLVRKIAKAHFVLVILPTLSYFLPVLWNYLDGTRVNLSRTTSTFMPMTSPYYEIGVLMHLIFFVVVAFGSVTIFLWFVFFTSFFCEVSECAVKILQVKRLKGSHKSYESRLNEALGKFYCVHVKLVEYLDMLKDLYKWSLLVFMLTILSCTCIFLLVASEETNWQLAAVMLPISFESFACNTLGERIKSKAQVIRMALLNFDWMSMRLKDRQNYYIIVCYMNRDVAISSAIGAEMSLLSLTSIYKGSYQVFAVLNTMKN